MAGPETIIVSHYDTGGLYDRIMSALAANGITREALEPKHLKYIDEFHIGGAAATEALLDPLRIGPDTEVLDIGSGLGGPARMIAAGYGAHVTGLDLTPDYVDTAQRLSLDLGQDIRFRVGSALDMPFEDDSFDLATLIHVGMNLPDKTRLFEEVARVLKPGATFAVYDVMLFGDHPEFPLPWASEPSASFLEPPERYEAAARATGMEQLHRRDRGDVARAFFADMQARMKRDGPPVVGPPLLMGETAPTKVANMVAAVSDGHIAPVEMVFRSSGSTR